MGSRTGISWTQKTWNPWQGCTKVSNGCKKCYMFRDKKFFGGSDPATVVRSKTTWKSPYKWKDPSLIFVCSWSDFFHKDADPWRDEAWDIIRSTPNHTYQILTKRPERIEECLPEDWGDDGWDHVWLGVTVEDQDNLGRLDILKKIPAKQHFVSAEPLLGYIDFEDHLEWIDWMVVGGESGAGCRPMDIDWARDIKRQVDEANEKNEEHKVFFFLKQLGGHPNVRKGPDAILDEEIWEEFPPFKEPVEDQGLYEFCEKEEIVKTITGTDWELVYNDNGQLVDYFQVE